MSVAQSVMLALGLSMTILAVVVPLGVLLGVYLNQRHSPRLIPEPTCARLCTPELCISARPNRECAKLANHTNRSAT